MTWPFSGIGGAVGLGFSGQQNSPCVTCPHNPQNQQIWQGNLFDLALRREIRRQQEMKDKEIRVTSTTMVRIPLKSLKGMLLNRAISEALEDGCPEPSDKQKDAAVISVLKTGVEVEGDVLEIEVRW